ncbi:MAG: oxidoreductase [Proteobacteria bacterium]|nr:oxidoreductase [Pseudomonadota bacterium]
MASASWSVRDLPDLSGKTAVVTGANSGLGYETTVALAGAGAHVVMACRSAEKAAEARRGVEAAHPNASLEIRALDLANLASVRDFAKSFLDAHERLHLLCNNAGVMALPFRKTADGFEMQIGTNHLGHFALTGLLLDRLLATPGARVVNVSSTMHKIGRMRLDDLHFEKPGSYGKWRAYGQSKLANLLFTYELGRVLEAAGRNLVVAASHPGYAATNLQFEGPRMEGSSLMERMSALGNRLFSQTAAGGALPSLYAAAGPDVRSGSYYGPSRMGELWGPPKKVRSNRRSHDRETATRLWQLSEEQTGIRYEGL